jgi:hypothetical protein
MINKTKKSIKGFLRNIPIVLLIRFGVVFAMIFYFMTFSFWVAIILSFITASAFVIYQLFFTEFGKLSVSHIKLVVEHEKLKSKLKKNVI